MRRSTLVQFIALAGCVALLYGASTRIPTINAGRARLNIMGAESPLANTPPEYVFYIQAFGAFRGLIADIAFLRADQLKEQGRFYDAHQLHKWICDLQPHFPTVWEYCAWNMAWNISVTTFTPQERWNWVYNGVKLLRDQGIPRNPRAVNLYKQLAWIFNNKMSENTDDQHYAYKTNWAWRMHLALGPPADPLAGLDAAGLADQLKSAKDLDRLAEAGRLAVLKDEESRRLKAQQRGVEYKPLELPPTAGADVKKRSEAEVTPFRMAQRAAEERLRELQDTPATLNQLYTRYPETRAMVAQLRSLGIALDDDELTEDDYWRDEGLAFALLKPYRDLTSPAGLLASVTRAAQPGYAADARRGNLATILGVRTGSAAGQALVHFVERQVVEQVYKLDLEHMLEVVRDFGPVDWRSCDAHSLYWVTRGLIAAREGPASGVSGDKMNTARIIFFSLRNLFLKNHIVFEPNPAAIQLSYLNLSRDLNFIGPLSEAYLKYGPLFDPTNEEGHGAGSTFRSGHINFITEAIRLLYLSGREAEADHYYRYLRETYPITPDGVPNPAFTKPLHDFVMDSFLESIEVPGVREIKIVIDGWLFNAYTQLASGDTTSYVRLVRAAQEYHENYMQNKRGDLGFGRQKIPEFADMQSDAFGNWLAPPAATPLQTLHKAKLWQVAPLYLRQTVYDNLLPLFRSECSLWNYDLAKAFPEPKDMDTYRKEHPGRAAQEAP
jgi:hypothetical protein